MRLLIVDTGRESSPIEQELWSAVSDILKKYGKEAISIAGIDKDNTPLKAEEKYRHLEWLNGSQFTEIMTEKGYRCKITITRKKLCDKFKIEYKERGNAFWYKNSFARVPERIRVR